MRVSIAARLPPTRSAFAECQVFKRAITWNSPVVVFAVVFCVVLTTATVVTRALYAKGGKEPAPPAQQFVSDWKNIGAVGHVTGRASAPVSVVVFADYQCPGCAELHKLLKVADDSLPGTLRVVTRHFPLSGHAHAQAAANAAECAAEQGRFREFETVAYAQQDSIGAKPWLRLAQEAGVRDTVDFLRCVVNTRHASAVHRDLGVARELGLVGTPAYLVNGHSYFGAPSLGELLAQLRKATMSVTATASPVSVSPETTFAPRTGGAIPARHWLSPLVLERSIAGADHDELLVPASLSATSSQHLVLFDFGAMELRAFNRQGQQLWRVGRKGAGPGEFQNAMDVEVRSNGEIAVLDMGNRRITSLSEAGRVLRTVPLTLSSHRFVPLSDTTMFALAVDDSSTLFTQVTAHGDSARRVAAPPGLTAHHGIERETFTAALGRGAVVAYRWSDKLALLGADGAVRRVVNGVESVLFPGTTSYPLKSGKFSGRSFRIHPAATLGTLSVTTRRHEIFALFGGATPNRGRIVDVYDGQSGSYKGSHLLPFPVLELVALADGGFATLRTEPIPSIDIWTVGTAVRP